MDNLKIGQYIQNLRKAAGMTQKELGDKLNISFQAVSKWENGDTLPDTGILLDLCDILHTTADKLLNGGSLAATERGVIRGMSGIRFEVDGDSFARLITPYVDQRLASSLYL